MFILLSKSHTTSLLDKKMLIHPNDMKNNVWNQLGERFVDVEAYKVSKNNISK